MEFQDKVFESSGAEGLDGHVSFSYDAKQDNYIIQDGTASFTAKRSDLVNSQDYTKAIDHSGPTATDSLKVFGNIRSPNPAGVPPIKLSYLSYGVWSHSDLQSNVSRNTFFLFGFPTQPSNMPKSGSAQYTGLAFGRQVFASHPEDPTIASGTATFTADFGTGAVDTKLSLTVEWNDEYNGSGVISSNGFSGMFTQSTDSRFTGGGFIGAFFGPNAEEAGYAFHLSGNRNPYSGASLRGYFGDFYTQGVVVGTKQP